MTVAQISMLVAPEKLPPCVFFHSQAAEGGGYFGRYFSFVEELCPFACGTSQYGDCRGAARQEGDRRGACKCAWDEIVECALAARYEKRSLRESWTLARCTFPGASGS